ncbi:hypothetical protein ACFL0I_01135, partial [Gemmatimonadota bacterium]
SVNKSILDASFQASPVPAGEVKVFFATDTLPPHTRIAILNASGDADFSNESQMIDKLREEAGKLGANAIVLGDLKDPGAGERAVNAWVYGYAGGERKSQALAIHCPSLSGGTSGGG